MRRALPLLALLCVAAAPALTDAQVRAFVAKQEQAWNKGDLSAYFAGFTADAVFTDQARANDNSIVLYGKSSLSEARRQAGRSRGRGPIGEAGQVTHVRLAAASADVSSYVVIRAAGRTSCAQRLQTLVLKAGRLRATSQTDTVVRCRRAR